MNKHPNHYDKEYLKMEMLKHEETFREQVYELHRLYRIQKTLMKDISKTSKHSQPRTRQLCLDNAEDMERPVDQEKDRKACYDLELTLGPIGYNNQRKVKATVIPSQLLPVQTQQGSNSSNSNNSNQPWLFKALSLKIA